MTTISRRHHYLPVFFVKGYIAPLTKLWVYDKVSDAILPSQKSPKSIFYEWNKNNIKIEGHEVDILESNIYKGIDDVLANHFKIIQNAEIDEVEQQEFINRVILMIAVTFYRTPANEIWTTELTNDIIKNKLPDEEKQIIHRISNLKISEEDKNKIISSISAFLNLSATENKLLKGKQNYKIVQTTQTCFVLSDNPIIYENLPTDFNELFSSVIFPLTEKRIYFGLKNNSYTFNAQIIKQVNIFLALQARRYFASTNKIFLQEILNAYKIMKPFEQDIGEMKKGLFEKINK